jgi:hypothetical protein
MKLSLPLIVIALVQAATASSTVVATATSSQPFLIRDVQVPVTGVSNWPVFSGDKVSTTSSSAVLSFHDGSRVVLEKNTSVIVVTNPNNVGLQVIKGKVLYKFRNVLDYAVGSVQRSLSTPPAAQGSATALTSGNLVFGTDSGVLSTLETFARTNASTASTAYPISITYGTLPSGVTSVSGPTPTSTIVPAQ